MRIFKFGLFISALITLSCTEDLGAGKFADLVNRQGEGASTPTPTPVQPTPTPVPQWRNKSFYQLQTGSEASGNGLAFDSAGNLYSVGQGVRDGVKYWLVRKSINKGATWMVVDEYTAESGLDSAALAIATNGNTIFVVGSAATNTGAPNYYWVVRRSTDSGASWATIDSATGDIGKYVEATAVAIGTNGQIVVTGSLHDGAKTTWSVRMSNDNGMTWNTVSTYSGDGNSRGSAAVVNTNGDIYVGGSGTDSNGKLVWLTAKSTNGGANWSQIDSWQLNANYDSELHALAIDQRGRVYAAGYGSNANGRHWILRRGVIGTDTFTTADDYVYPTDSANNSNSMAKSIAFDSRNSIYVTGFGSTNSGGNQKTIAVIRKSTTNGVTFTTDDAYQPTPNQTNAMGNAIMIDGDGRIFSSGIAEVGTPSWFIRGNP